MTRRFTLFVALVVHHDVEVAEGVDHGLVRHATAEDRYQPSTSDATCSAVSHGAPPVRLVRMTTVR